MFEKDQLGQSMQTMKVEGEPVICHSNVSPKLVPKSFECDDDAFDSSAMKLENQNELVGKVKADEEVTDQVHNNNATNGWIAANDDYDEVKAFMSPLTNSSKVELFEEDSEFYMEKSIVECQLPELIVCYKENICNIVKDICIDEGVPSRDKLLYDSNVDEKAICTIIPLEKAWNDLLTKEVEKSDIFTSDRLEHSESSSIKDLPKLCDSKDLTRTPEAEYDVEYFIENDVPNLSMADLVAESSKPCVDNNNEVHPQTQQVSSETANFEIPVKFSAAEECNGNTKETTSAYTTTEPASEGPKNSTVVNDLSYDSTLDNGTITFNFNSLACTDDNRMEYHDHNGDLNSSAPTTSASVGCHENSSSKILACTDKCQTLCHSTSNSKYVDYEDFLKADVGISNRLSVSSQVQHGIGESSFSAVGPLASLMCNSDRMAYSGSISLRSDSSTTSTRSFAFPILQSEWNSSPVRMAKADRKQYFRKPRCWKQRLILCCRF